MQGEATKLVAYMDGANTQFVIPVYQRNYDWKQENCKQLFDDLVKVIRENRKSHFFGSIVSAHCDGSFNEFQVIDGQQRLTTVSLLFLAMVNLIRAGAVTAEDENLADMIYETYLINKFKKGEKRIRLKPVKDDQTAFAQLFQPEEQHIPESNLTINYRYFCEQIRKERITVDELFEAISRLEIINITLSHDDNPQLIFESLNSTGLALSEGDKIRNYILMGLPMQQQNDCYEQYWNPIERCTGYQVDAFVRDYLSVKQQAIPVMSKVYVTFKAYVEAEKPTTEALLQDMLAYAKRYEKLLRGNTKDKALDACIYRLNRLETTVTRPFFLEVLRMQEEGAVLLEEAREIFLITENYLFRRMICNLQTNVLNKIFLLLHREIIRYDGSNGDYLRKFKYALLSKSERGEFPRDEAFLEALSTREVYQMNPKNKLYILERIENGGTKETKEIYGHVDAGTYTIEHIMPQHLTQAWAEALGEDYEHVHETWLHRLANLTLTAYNAKYSNNSFEKKRDGKDGFRESGLRMNTWIAAQSKWTESELKERNRMLKGKALELWPLPETDYAPAEKQLDCYTLEDDVDLSGRDLVRYEYRGAAQPVESWLSMQEQILRQLHEENKSVLMLLAHAGSEDSDLAVYVSHDPGKLRSALKIDDGLYVERNTSTNLKLTMLRKFFKLYGANPEDLVLYLRDRNEKPATPEEGSLADIRRKYWAFALPYIQETHGPEGSFQNVHPVKENWINGSVGISGFSVTVVANTTQARVDLTLWKQDREKNKSAFDFLYARRAEIEGKLGTQLDWQRADNFKSSFAVLHLKNVNVRNETDWLQMAKFHALWSKKFYDVFVPLLQQWNG